MSCAYQSPEESLARLRQSGWSMGEAGFTDASGHYIHQVDGRNGENRIRVERPIRPRRPSEHAR